MYMNKNFIIMPVIFALGLSISLIIEYTYDANLQTPFDIKTQDDLTEIVDELTSEMIES